MTIAEPATPGRARFGSKAHYYDFTHQVVVVTGGASGIGRTIAI